MKGWSKYPFIHLSGWKIGQTLFGKICPWFIHLVATSLVTTALVKISIYPLIQSIDHTRRVPNTCSINMLIKISVYPVIQVKNWTDSLCKKFFSDLSIYPAVQHTHLVASSQVMIASIKISVYQLIRVKNCTDNL